MLYCNYKNLYSELSPDGGVAGTTSIGTWLEIAPYGVVFYYLNRHSSSMWFVIILL